MNRAPRDAPAVATAMPETAADPAATGRAAPTAAAAPPLLRLQNISMRFGAVTALADVSFDVRRGEVVALLGDNGAGKSTLVRIIAGEQRPTAGQVLFDGEARHFDSPSEAKEAGIETVYQDLSLCMNVDVVANFFMGRELVKRVAGIPILREREMQAQTEQALRSGGTEIPSVRINVEHLSGGQRQAIELNRFVHWGGKLVLLDEPFAALGVEQTRRGLDMIERVRAQDIAVVVITHNLLHAFQVADRVVVLRHGRVTGDLPAADTGPDDVVRMITGDIA